MRKLAVVLGLWAIGCGWAVAQIEKSADEWLNRTFQAYSQLNELRSTTTISAILYTPRTPQGEFLQSFRYTYTCRKPAQLELTVENLLHQEGGKRALSCDGKELKVGEQSFTVANSGMALIEQLVSADVVPTYDMVFLYGGRSSQEKFRNQISALKISKEDESQVVLTGKMRKETKGEDDLEIVIDKSTALMRSLRLSARYKLEGTDSVISLVMEFQPSVGGKEGQGSDSEPSPPKREEP